jgi:hypothetical protein
MRKNAAVALDFTNEAEDTGLWSYGSETRAYDCITKVFTTILEDKEVREAFLSPAAGS